MRTTLLIFILFSFSLKSQPLQIQQPVRFLALGDSYTIGQSVSVSERWPVQLNDSLAVRGVITDSLRIIATTGWTTNNLIAAISNQNLQNQNYNLVSLLIGVNNQYQGKPINQFITEFSQLVDSAIRYAGGDTNHVFIVSIPDYAYTPFGQSSGNAIQISLEINTYNAICKNVADSLGIKYFDITPISRLGLMQPDLVAIDGLHPSGKQYGKWVHLMLQYLDSIGLTAIPEYLNEGDELIIFPNPVKEFVFFDSLSKTNIHIAEIKLFSLDGKLIKSEKLNGNENSIFIGDLHSGTYLLSLINREGLVRSYKIFKSK
jgi:lysophospholipase L1-like esterase